MAGLTKEERAKREAAKKAVTEKPLDNQVCSETSSSDVLKEENEQLKKQLQEMMNMIKNLQNTKTVAHETVTSASNPDGIKDVEMNARILVTSMTTGGVNMKTSNDGSARHFRLEKIGQTIPIIYEHLINCINTDRWLFEDGLVYIGDPNVVREQCLEESYKKFLTPDKIENILNFDTETIVDMISSTTPTIQETIINLVASQINKGGYIDMNKVEAIGNACDKKVDIRELANKLR